MKLRNIFITGMSAIALASCSDYLEVDAPSKNLPQDVFSDARAMERARNGVYASMLTSNMFGDKLINTFVRNSDVDFVSNSSQYTTTNKYCRFDCDPSGSDLKSTWDALYHGIELCSLFIEGAEGSPSYDPERPDADIVQMIGEAKVARAMFYHELIWNFGDVPFSTKSSQTSETKVYPVTDRIQILDFLIKDIAATADGMKTPDKITEGVERISRLAAYAMISRLAMTAGGWYLAPDGDTYGKMVRTPNYLEYYTIAREYADKVIKDGTHKLSLPYYQVFYNECNNLVRNDDDVIFEIPFGKESTGNIGYIHGPKMDQYEGITPHPYGKASSSARLNAFYRFMFDSDDLRRDYVNQLFRYTSDGTDYSTKLENSYTVQNGKWSKLWVNGGLGEATEGNTGINYPYLRYADVLLMYAEADNEIEGAPRQEAIDAVAEVRKRAFKTTPEKIQDFAHGNYDDFKKAILDERKFEFAGENMRWRDLIRNNMYKEEIFWTFFRYYYKAEDMGNLPVVAYHDFEDENGYNNLPAVIVRVLDMPNTYNKSFIDKETGTVYAQEGDKILDTWQFPNDGMKICWTLNPYDREPTPSLKEWQTVFKDIPKEKWVQETVFDWSNDDGVKNEIRNSLLGYIYLDDSGLVKVVRNGVPEIVVEPEVGTPVENLPEVRYILPYPRDVIARSQGKYVNKYGYN